MSNCDITKVTMISAVRIPEQYRHIRCRNLMMAMISDTGDDWEAVLKFWLSIALRYLTGSQHALIAACLSQHGFVFSLSLNKLWLLGFFTLHSIHTLHLPQFRLSCLPASEIIALERRPVRVKLGGRLKIFRECAAPDAVRIYWHSWKSK